MGQSPKKKGEKNWSHSTTEWFYSQTRKDCGARGSFCPKDQPDFRARIQVYLTSPGVDGNLALGFSNQWDPILVGN